MNTTIDLDDRKLARIMELTGLKTPEEVVDWSLTEAERLAGIQQIAERPWEASVLRDSVDPSYDLLATRRQAR